MLSGFMRDSPGAGAESLIAKIAFIGLGSVTKLRSNIGIIQPV
jgi:hypothetical protein